MQKILPKQEGVVVFFLFLCFFSMSCAQTPSKIKSSKAVPSQTDAATDETLGVLGETEAEKKVRELEAQLTEEEAVKEVQKRQLEEEQRRTHRSIVDDQILKQQT